MNTNILVLGSGPAGITAAAGLAQLGYKPLVIGNMRIHEVTEGISQRVISALQYGGFTRALATVSKPVPRCSEWNGESISTSSENLICRKRFDKAMLNDMQRKGVSYIDGLVEKMERSKDRWMCNAKLSNGNSVHINANYLVDARGRAAPLNRALRERGPDSVSIYQNWTVPKGSPFTTVATTAIGWLWLADNGSGNLYTQLTTDSQSRNFTSKRDISAAIFGQIKEAGITYEKLNKMAPTGAPGARSSTPVFSGKPISEKIIRIGDAAMAPDPLSGSGIFMALSSALIAPAVINTILQRPWDSALASDFYHNRLTHQFKRLGRMGRDFYNMEARWQSAPFWEDRLQWPDSIPVEDSSDSVIDISQRAVVNHGWIERKTVAITEQHPQGIWKVDNRNVLRHSGA